MGDSRVNRHTVLLMPITVAEGNSIRFNVLTASDERERNLLLGSIADLLTETIVRLIHLNADALRTQLSGDVGDVSIERSATGTIRAWTGANHAGKAPA